MFKEISDVIESRAAGWMEKALEICGCKEVKIVFTKSMLRGDDRTQFAIKWEK